MRFSNPDRRLRRARALGLLIALAATASAFAQTPPRLIEQVKPGTIAALGIVEPVSEEREIAFDVKGKLAEVLVDEGDPVKAGAIVARLENADLKARLDAAEATVRLRDGELRRLVNGARPEERQEARAALDEAEAAYGLAKSEIVRRSQLADKGVVSAQLLDQGRTALAIAEAKRAGLRERLTMIMGPPREEDVAIAEAQLGVARAQAAEAQAQLERTYLRAPIDGTVLRLFKRTGEAVSETPVTPVMDIGDTHRLRIRTEVDEADVARVAIGQQAIAKADAYGERAFTGTVSRISSRFGRKRIETEAPTEKHDTRVLEVLIELEEGTPLPIGLRLDVLIAGSERTAQGLASAPR